MLLLQSFLFSFWSNNAHSAIHPSMTVVVIVTGRRKWSKGKPNGSGTVRWLCGFAFLVLSGWGLFHTAGQLSIQVGNKNTVMDEKGFQNSLEAASFFLNAKMQTIFSHIITTVLSSITGINPGFVPAARDIVDCSNVVVILSSVCALAGTLALFSMSLSLPYIFSSNLNPIKMSSFT